MYRLEKGLRAVQPPRHRSQASCSRLGLRHRVEACRLQADLQAEVVPLAVLHVSQLMKVGVQGEIDGALLGSFKQTSY